VKQENSRVSELKYIFSVMALALAVFGVAPVSFAQATIRVPQDFPTIQLAVNAASAGDTIRVGPGRWCGARITKTLNLVGEGATIMGCPGGRSRACWEPESQGLFRKLRSTGDQHPQLHLRRPRFL
jgi:hypothetical protein